MNKKQRKIKNLIITSTVMYLMSLSGVNLSRDNLELKVLTHNLDFSSEHDLNIVAHRGFSGSNVDNSESSIRDALISNCVDYVEVDIRETIDHQFVLSHDSYVNVHGITRRIEYTKLDDIINSGDRSNVTMSFEYINNILSSSDRTIEKIRTIRKVFDNDDFISLDRLIEIYDFNKPLIIDIKSVLSRDSMENLFNKLYNYSDSIVIQSSNIHNLMDMQRLYPMFSYSLIIDSKNDLDYVDYFKNYTVKVGFLPRLENNPDSKYFIWLVGENNFDRVMRLIKRFNIDNCYFITDNPDIICTMYEENKRSK